MANHVDNPHFDRDLAEFAWQQLAMLQERRATWAILVWIHLVNVARRDETLVLEARSPSRIAGEIGLSVGKATAGMNALVGARLVDYAGGRGNFRGRATILMSPKE